MRCAPPTTCDFHRLLRALKVRYAGTWHKATAVEILRVHEGWDEEVRLISVRYVPNEAEIAWMLEKENRRLMGQRFDDGFDLVPAPRDCKERA